jgi:hypothetical protein
MELPMEVKVMYDRGDAGHCMTCGTPVGEHANAVINEFGWALLYCGQACLQDMIIANYLADQYGNINEEIKQRGDNRE